MKQNWRPLIARLQRAYEAARQIDVMERDEEADAVWAAAYPDLTEARPGLLGAMLGRAEAQVMRLACIYALLDGTGTVGARHLNAALALWRYSERSARFVFGESHGDPRGEKILAALKAAKGGLTQSEVSGQVFGRNLKKDQLAKLLNDLLDFGLIHRTKRVGVGRPATVYHAGSACRAVTR